MKKQLQLAIARAPNLIRFEILICDMADATYVYEYAYVNAYVYMYIHQNWCT
jgi:hypothetical protein